MGSKQAKQGSKALPELPPLKTWHYHYLSIFMRWRDILFWFNQNHSPALSGGTVKSDKTRFCILWGDRSSLRKPEIDRYHCQS